MICVSFDTDYLSEGRLTEFLSRSKLPGKATFFCTERFADLDATKYELAPHPYLPAGGDWAAELAAKRQMLPTATGWRSHSCVFSHLLARWVGENGYKYVSIEERFGQPGLKPTRHPMGTIWQIPIYYMDTFDISRQVFWSAHDVRPFDTALIERALGNDGIYVFDFHPVHILLNTPAPEFYFTARDRFRDGAPTESIRYGGYGVGTFFDELCNRMHAAGIESAPIADALTAHIEETRELR